MTEREALKLALEALEEAADAIDSWGSYASGYFQVKHDLEGDISKAKSAITAIKEALAQPEQEPVEVFLTDEHQMGFKVGVQSFILDYWPDLQSEVEFMKTQLLTAFARAAPPQRKPLTDEEIHTVYITATNQTLRAQDERLAFAFARAIEAAHGIKENT